MFCEAVQAEYSMSVIKDILSQEPETEPILSDFFHDLCQQLSVDQQTVSVNSFELLTRKAGLKLALAQILSDCLQRHKHERSTMLNDTIVNELTDVKACLDKKAM